MAASFHYGILRGKDVRGIQLPDIQPLLMDPREGPTICDFVVILQMEGKNNQERKTQHCGTMRNKDGSSVSHRGNAMAMWLFYNLVGLTVIARFRIYRINILSPRLWLPDAYPLYVRMGIDTSRKSGTGGVARCRLCTEFPHHGNAISS